MDIRSGKLVQVIANGKKHQYGFYFPEAAPIVETIEALEELRNLFTSIKEKNDEKKEPEMKVEEKELEKE